MGARWSCPDALVVQWPRTGPAWMPLWCNGRAPVSPDAHVMQGKSLPQRGVQWVADRVLFRTRAQITPLQCSTPLEPAMNYGTPPEPAMLFQALPNTCLFVQWLQATGQLAKRRDVVPHCGRQ